jgi:hypothetical protein
MMCVGSAGSITANSTLRNPNMTTTPTAASQHTPTPWSVLDLRHQKGGKIHIMNGPCQKTIAVCYNRDTGLDETAANAALIVTAVNSHTALVARVAELEELVNAAADSFRDGAITFEMFLKPTAAAAMWIAEDAMRAALAKG